MKLRGLIRAGFYNFILKNIIINKMLAVEINVSMLIFYFLKIILRHEIFSASFFMKLRRYRAGFYLIFKT